MSFLYPLYSCFTPYPHTLYPFFLPTELQPPSPPINQPNHRSLPPSSTDSAQFKPLLLLPTNTSENLPRLQGIPLQRKQAQERRQNLKRKDEVYGWRNQNKGRNQNSTILRGYVQQVLQSQGMLKQVERLSKKRSIQNGVSRFLHFIAQKFPTRKSYVGLRYMQDLIKEAPFNEDMTFLLVMTLRYYLKEVYPLQIVENLRLKKRERMGLLRKGRTIWAILLAS